MQLNILYVTSMQGSFTLYINGVGVVFLIVLAVHIIGCWNRKTIDYTTDIYAQFS